VEKLHKSKVCKKKEKKENAIFRQPPTLATGNCCFMLTGAFSFHLYF